MRPACLPPRPLAGCRRKQSSIDGDPSFSIHLSLCSTGFHRLPRSYEEDPTSAWTSAGRRCLLSAYRSRPIAHARWGALRGPMQTSQGKDTGCTINAGQASASHHSSTASISVSTSSVAIMAHQTAVGKSESIRLAAGPETGAREGAWIALRRGALDSLQPAFSYQQAGNEGFQWYVARYAGHPWPESSPWRSRRGRVEAVMAFSLCVLLVVAAVFAAEVIWVVRA